MIFVESKKKSLKTLRKLHPNAKIIDVTSKGNQPFVKLSPFYPHGNIPVPFTTNCFSMSVEGIWQGLKVFEFNDIDTSKFEVKDMKGIKRTVRKYGKPLGHRNGIKGTKLLNYLDARKQIYLQSYAWVLQNLSVKEIELLVNIAKESDLVLLDYETNCDIENIKKPLSHASLIKKFIDKKYPEIATLHFSTFEKIVDSNAKCETKTQSSKKVKKSGTKKIKDVNQLSMDF